MLLFGFGCFLLAVGYSPVPTTFGASVRQSAIDPGKRKRPNKRRFDPKEDKRLNALVNQYGTGNWDKVAEFMPDRSPRQCRERWTNYANPDLSHDPWTAEEDDLLLQKFEEFRPKWHTIALFFKNRSRNACRNRWQQLQKHCRNRRQQLQKQILPQQRQQSHSGSDGDPTQNSTEDDSNPIGAIFGDDPKSDLIWI
jgi:hypothetical protein